MGRYGDRASRAGVSVRAAGRRDRNSAGRPGVAKLSEEEVLSIDGNIPAASGARWIRCEGLVDTAVSCAAEWCNNRDPRIRIQYRPVASRSRSDAAETCSIPEAVGAIGWG